MIDPRLKENVIRSLEERALRAWPALLSAPCGGWVLRYAKGFTRRANSANALAPSVPFRSIRPLVEIFYRSHHQPVVFRLTPLAGADPDRLLEAAGYVAADPTLVMVARLPDSGALPPDVQIEAEASEEWRLGFAAVKAVPATQRAIHDRIIAAIDAPAAFAVIRHEGQPIAYGLAVADRGVVGLFDIVVSPEARRKGAGNRITAALLAWGRAQGAMGAYLQVLAENRAAIALYSSLGFEEAYTYHYRVLA
jgi:N-acetylglutamate synthase